MNNLLRASVAAVLAAIAQNAVSEDLLTIYVTEYGGTENKASGIDAKQNIFAKESAELLRQIPGVSGSRMGGHGIDPTIRGLDQTQLNVLIDGAYIHGGCPNRMDPPTAYAPAENFEKVTVIKGMQTLEYGSGGPGGTVLFERQTPRFYADENVRVKGAYTYNANGDTRDLSADLAAGTPDFFARVLSKNTDAGNYDDGDGNEVRSAYKETNNSLILGYTPTDHDRLEFTVERQDTTDLLYQGAGMDSPYADSDVYRLKYQTAEVGDIFSDTRVELYQSNVSHLMDNYSLRTPPTMMGMPMKMSAPSTSDTLGGRLVTNIKQNSRTWKMGLDFQNNDKDAVRYNDNPATPVAQSILWPGASIEQIGLFGEVSTKIAAKDKVIFGLRYDHVNADADKADIKPSGMSANQLYAKYYNGAQATKQSENNIGGLLRYEHSYSPSMTLYSGLSRTVRTADVTERYMAANKTNDNWVGNPYIDPEKHHQLELGVIGKNSPVNWDASVYYNRVSDYILRDRVHTGADNSTIYRNVSATLYGFELNSDYLISDEFFLSGGLAYVHANNDTDNRAIAQTPPLEGFVGLDYLDGDFNLGSKIRFADNQTRVDDDPNTGSGEDTGKTPGWAVFDIYGSYSMNDNFDIDFGIDNVFDKTYYQHLNRASGFDTTVTSVNEPGRSVWIKLKAEL